MINSSNKVFCSYAFTGEDEKLVNERMQLIADSFKDCSVQAYCNLFDTRVKGFTNPKQFMDAALIELKQSDILFVVMTSERRSEGMLLEVGAAYSAGIPIILARHESAEGKTYIDQLAQKTVDWKTNEDLKSIIQTLCKS